MATLMLTRPQLRRAVHVPELAAELRTAMAGYDGATEAHRLGTAVGPRVTSMVLAPGTAHDVPAYTVKVHAKNPIRQPALTGVICLHDLASGDLLAILDSGWLTALRTGIGGALGADVLARRDACDVGVVGAGAQGRAQLSALATLRSLASVHVHDTNPAIARTFADRVGAELAVPTRVHDDVRALVPLVDILLVATWSRAPVLTSVRPGSHVTSLGADEPAKRELDTRLLADASVFADDRRLAAPMLPRIDATLGDVLRGEHPGRRDAAEVTVYSPVGLPMQDCVAAWHAYRRARELGLGLELDLESDLEP